VLFEQNETQVFNVSKPYVDETSEPHLLLKQTTKSNILEKTEVGLAQARAAIREVRNENYPTLDSDYVPMGPVYLNPKTFHRYNYFHALLIIMTH